MDRPTYEDRQKRRLQSASIDRNRFDTPARVNREPADFKWIKISDRSFNNGRKFDDESSAEPWNPANHEHLNARPVSYQDLHDQSFSTINRDSTLYQDSQWRDRNSGTHGAWDDRPLRFQRFDSSYPTSSYGFRFDRQQRLPQNGNANQATYENASQVSFARDDQGNFGSYEFGQTFSSRGFRGNPQGFNQDSQGYSPTHYGTQLSGFEFGQQYDTGHQLYGNESFASNKSGRGPKGYKRSDERIKEDVCELLTSHPEIDPSEVDVQVQSSEITLTGTIDNRHQKRLIEDLASSVSGVIEVNNRLRVMKAMSSDRSQPLGSGNTMSGSHRELSSPVQSSLPNRSR